MTTLNTIIAAILTTNSLTHAASKKIWDCQATCLVINSEAQTVRLAGPESFHGYGLYRKTAFDNMTALCGAAAKRLGLPEAITTNQFSFTTTHDRSSSGADSNDEREFTESYGLFSYKIRERRHLQTESFHSHNELTLSVRLATMTDPSVCSEEVVDANWEPAYQPLPGDGEPRG